MSPGRHSQIPAKGRRARERRPAVGVEAPQAPEDAAAPGAAEDIEQGPAAEPEALKLLAKQFHELGDYVSYYVAAKTDSAKLFLRTSVLWIVLAALGFVVLAGVIITAAWFAMSGIAVGMSILFGGRVWAGNLVTGVLLLTVLGLTMYAALGARRRTSRERTVQKYEQRQARQQEDFGRSVGDSAEAADESKK